MKLSGNLKDYIIRSIKAGKILLEEDFDEYEDEDYEGQVELIRGIMEGLEMLTYFMRTCRSLTETNELDETLSDLIKDNLESAYKEMEGSLMSLGKHIKTPDRKIKFAEDPFGPVLLKIQKRIDEIPQNNLIADYAVKSWKRIYALMADMIIMDGVLEGIEAYENFDPDGAEWMSDKLDEIKDWMTGTFLGVKADW
jgi:hypothetical protein